MDGVPDDDDEEEPYVRLSKKGEFEPDEHTKVQSIKQTTTETTTTKKTMDIFDSNFNIGLPHNVEIMNIPRLSEIKSIWHTGMKRLESVFQDHIQKMTMEFDIKTNEYAETRDHLVANHEFLVQFLASIQGKLDMAGIDIRNQRSQFEHEKSEIQTMVNLDSEVVAINVGGTHHMMTERDVLRLCPGSTLEKMFNGMHELKKINEEVFLDRDGTTFQHLVNYLRNDREVLPEFADYNDELHFFKELDFWKVPLKPHQKGLHANPKSNVRQTEQIHSHSHNNTSTNTGTFGRQRGSHAQMHSHSHTTVSQSYKQNQSAASIRKTVHQNTLAPPKMPAQLLENEYAQESPSDGGEDSQGVALKAAKDKWNQLGPLRLEDIVQNSQEPIDQSMKFGQSAYNKYIIGQLGPNGKVTGVGKEINHIIYEGQFVDDVYNGYGRFIYSNGNYYIGQWLDGKRSGYGKLVDKTGRVYEGQWQYSKYMGQGS